MGARAVTTPIGSGSRRRFGVVAAVVSVAVAASACAPALLDPTRPPAGSPAQPDKPCAEAAVTSCALPYPSDEFTLADVTSPTGIRVHMPSGIIPAAVQKALGPGATMEDAFGGADGFSALSPVIFEFDTPVRSERIPHDGGDVVRVYDVTTGERQDIRVDVWTDAAFRGAPATIVIAWPVTKWDDGHRLVARAGDVKGLFTDPVAPASVVAAQGSLAKVRSQLSAVDDMAWADVQSATGFTVGSREAQVGPLEQMAEIARADDHPVRNLTTEVPFWFMDHGAALVSGEVRVTDFRDADGVASADRAPTETWVKFMLTVPKVPASANGAPVVVYGHGLLVSKETMVVVAAENARKGFATIGIDVPNHGARQAGQGGFLLDLTKPSKLGRLASIPTQGIVDHVSLVQAITEHLDDIDVSPWNLGGAPGDGKPDLDTSLLLYQGTSMGGVLGLAEYAVNPEFEAAYLQVPGVGIIDILSHSLLWPLFAPIIPSAASAGDAAALLGTSTMLLDDADATHLLDDLRASGRPVMAQVGIGDQVVPEFSSNRMVKLLDLPRIGTARTDIEASSELAEVPADGNGFQELWPNAAPQTQGFLAHTAFVEPAAAPLLSAWLDGRLAAAGLDARP